MVKNYKCIGQIWRVKGLTTSLAQGDWTPFKRRATKGHRSCDVRNTNAISEWKERIDRKFEEHLNNENDVWSKMLLFFTRSNDSDLAARTSIKTLVGVHQMTDCVECLKIMNSHKWNIPELDYVYSDFPMVACVWSFNKATTSNKERTWISHISRDNIYLVRRTWSSVQDPFCKCRPCVTARARRSHQKRTKSRKQMRATGQQWFGRHTLLRPRLLMRNFSQDALLFARI